jgi:hypothetical protein
MRRRSMLNSLQKYTLLMPVGKTGRNADENERHPVFITRYYEI